MRVLAALVLLFPVISGQVIASAPTIEMTGASVSICDLFPYLPGCPR